MPATKAKTRLFDLEALEVSFVPRGANNRKILLTKSEKGEQMEDILKELLESDLENEGAIDEKIEKSLPDEIRKDKEAVAKVQATMKAAVKLIQSLGKRLDDKDKDKLIGQLGNLAGFKKVAKEEPKADPKPPAKTADPKDPVKKEDEMDPKMKAQIETILKASDEKIEKVQKENEALRVDVKKEQDLRITKEFEDKAKSYGHLGGKSKEIGLLLKEASENLPKAQYEQMVAIFKSSDAKISAGNLFSERGASGGGEEAEGSVYAQVEVKKEEIMKSNDKLTPEQAEEKVFERYPKLYSQYLDENPKQGGH